MSIEMWICLLPILIGVGIVYGVMMMRTFDSERRKLDRSVYGRLLKRRED